MKKYRDSQTGKRILEVYDLSFLSERDSGYGWVKLHFNHFRLKFFLKRADRIYVPDCTLAIDLVRYYFVPKEKIVVDKTIFSVPHKAKRRDADADR